MRKLSNITLSAALGLGCVATAKAESTWLERKLEENMELYLAGTAASTALWLASMTSAPDKKKPQKIRTKNIATTENPIPRDGSKRDGEDLTPSVLKQRIESDGCDYFLWMDKDETILLVWSEASKDRYYAKETRRAVSLYQIVGKFPARGMWDRLIGDKENLNTHQMIRSHILSGLDSLEKRSLALKTNKFEGDLDNLHSLNLSSSSEQ